MARRRTAARFEEPLPRPMRRAMRRRKRWSLIYLLELLFCIVLISGFAYAFSTYIRESPRFKVSGIIVEGAQVLREETVLEAAHITADQNVLSLDVQAIEDRVEHLSYVRHCKVQRAYPNKIQITIAERVAIATLLLNNRTFELDEDAVVLRELGQLEPQVGPLISEVPGLNVAEVGQKLDIPEIHAALALWKAYAAAPISEELIVSEIAAYGEDALIMFCEQLPCQLIWGRSDFVAQAQRLTVLWRSKGGQLPCKEYLDLRFDEDIVSK